MFSNEKFGEAVFVGLILVLALTCFITSVAILLSPRLRDKVDTTEGNPVKVIGILVSRLLNNISNTSLAAVLGFIIVYTIGTVGIHFLTDVSEELSVHMFGSTLRLSTDFEDRIPLEDEEFSNLGEGRMKGLPFVRVAELDVIQNAQVKDALDADKSYTRILRGVVCSLILMFISLLISLGTVRKYRKPRAEWFKYGIYAVITVALLLVWAAHEYLETEDKYERLVYHVWYINRHPNSAPANPQIEASPGDYNAAKQSMPR